MEYTFAAAPPPPGMSPPRTLPRRRRSPGTVLAVGVVLVALGATISACGTAPSSSSSPPSPAASASGSPAPGPAPTGGPNPNAPEVNPAGDIPDNQVYVAYTPPGAAFTVSVPQGWARASRGPATVFTDKFNSVAIESGPAPSAPDVAGAQAQLIPKLRATVPGFGAPHASMVTRSAGPALLITYTAGSPPNPVTAKSVTEAVERYTFFKAGQQVTLTLSAPQGSDNVDPWRTITNSFRWLR